MYFHLSFADCLHLYSNTQICILHLGSVFRMVKYPLIPILIFVFHNLCSQHNLFAFILYLRIFTFTRRVLSNSTFKDLALIDTFEERALDWVDGQRPTRTSLKVNKDQARLFT